MNTFYDDFISDMNWINETCRQRAADFPICLQARAEQQLCWSNELNLMGSGFYLFPLWLRDEFCIDAAIARELAVSNVFGLRYFMLQDAVMDSRGGGDEVPFLVPLGAFCFSVFEEIYHRYFPVGHVFWGYYQKYLQEWAESVVWEYSEHWNRLSEYKAGDLILLARKAAALKIPAAAVCWLAGRKEAAPALEKMVDCWQGLFQLQDDFQDWRKDLNQGNYTLLLVRAASYCGIEQADLLTAAHVKRAVYIGGVGEEVLSMAIDLGQQALASIADYNLPYFKSYFNFQIEALQEQCCRLREQRTALLRGGLHRLNLGK